MSSLLAYYKRELRIYDARPGRYKPRWVITPVGAALLLHRNFDTRLASPFDADHAKGQQEGGGA